MHQYLHYPYVMLAGFIAACTVNASPPSNGPAPSANAPNAAGASATDVDRCKHAGCDKMKFFGCNSADEQAACYADCDKANANQIDLFASCAENSVCDPACRTNIAPPATSANSSRAGATPASCGPACDKIVSCSFIPVGAKDQCVTQCEKSAYQYQIDCVSSNACDKIKAACGDPTSTSGGGNTDALAVQQCQLACDTLSFSGCLDAAAHQKCRDACATAPADKRDAFTPCANGAAGDCARGQDCSSQLTE